DTPAAPSRRTLVRPAIHPLRLGLRSRPAQTPTSRARRFRFGTSAADTKPGSFRAGGPVHVVCPAGALWPRVGGQEVGYGRPEDRQRALALGLCRGGVPIPARQRTCPAVERRRSAAAAAGRQ